MLDLDQRDETASPDRRDVHGVTTRVFAQPVSTPHRRRDDTVLPPPIIPGYRVVRQLGIGGMGVVFEAVEERLQRRVALKVMRPGFDGPAVRKRFEDEATILAQLSHRNVVPVYAAGEAGSWLYSAMKLVEGGPLSDRLGEGFSDAATAVRLLAKIARAVQYLHDRGIWHRDLKPTNILIDDDGEPLVADFGVAKWVEGDQHTLGFTRVGTFAYMAPEMIEFGSGKSDAQADVWSLGVMLYELLTGARPFAGDNNDPTLPARVVNAPPPPPAESPALAPGIDERLERIVLTALAKNPAHRYPSAAALAADLDRWLCDGTPETPSLPVAWANAARAVPPTEAAKTSTPRRRFRAVVATVLALGGLFVLGWKFSESGASPTPADAETILEELAVNGKSVVVDAGGKVRHPLTKLDGSQGEFGHDETGGFLRASGSPLALYEIADKAPPTPYRLRAMVYHSWGATRSFVGVYVRRGGRPTATGPFHEHDFVAVGLDSMNLGNNFPGKATFGADFLDWNRQADVRFAQTRLREHPVVRHAADLKDFRELILDVHEDHVVAVADGRPMRAVSWEYAAGILKLRPKVEGKPVPALALGDGFGLIVSDGTAEFRDVIVSRLH